MATEETLILTNEFHEALDLLNSDSSDPVFITGSAGTGKSTLLKLFRDSTDQRTVCLAPTGVAALNIGGQTIHSFFGFPPRLLQHGDFKIWKNKRLIKKLDTIIIDEISMVRADLLDAIDYFLKEVRKSEEPFGGIKMVFFGDLFQLPPVVRSTEEGMYFRTEYDSPYFFSSHAIQDAGLQIYELNEVFRQRDPELIGLLGRFRNHTFDQDDLDNINECVDPNFVCPEYCVTLAGRNATVDSINRHQLNLLDGLPSALTAEIKGKFSPSAYPADNVLMMKPGAQVIFLRNDPELRFVNGSLGKVREIADDYILVDIKDDGNSNCVEVKKFKWDMLEYELSSDQKTIKSKSVGEFTQYPLRLAWALTIHKAQGKTFDQVFIDLSRGGAFESGQTYVALSRCKTKSGIVLKQALRKEDIKIDHMITEFFKYGV